VLKLKAKELFPANWIVTENCLSMSAKLAAKQELEFLRNMAFEYLVTPLI
jgi:hypothetical protein